MEYGRFHSGLMPANLITFVHFSVSSAMSEEPGALAALAGICAGGGEKSPSLPRPPMADHKNEGVESLWAYSAGHGAPAASHCFRNSTTCAAEKGAGSRPGPGAQPQWTSMSCSTCSATLAMVRSPLLAGSLIWAQISAL